jgi:DNA-binding HxlR family transcriptional regulator
MKRISMAHPDDVSLMSRFVKLLGDRGRLAIVGLLAARPRTFQELAQELPNVSESLLQRHLRLLEDAEWVATQPDERYHLRADALTTLRAALARAETAPTRLPDSNDAVLKTFFDKEGRLRGLPTQRGRWELVLRHVADRCFALGRSYEEQEVNNLLIPLYEDYPTLRRALVAAGFLESRDGRYWLSLKRASESPRS